MPSFLHWVVRRAQAGGVDDVRGHATNIYGLTYGVACRAGYVGDYGELLPRQAVQQARLADVGLACQHDMDPFAQETALPGGIKHFVQPLLNCAQPPFGICRFEKIDLFIGEVERRLHQRPQVDECARKLMYSLRKCSVQ